MNRLQQVFAKKDREVLNIYFTAGYPYLDATADIAHALRDAGADLIELGMPYSDPLADGETIQKSSQLALRNGMNLELLFRQVRDIRRTNDIPIVVMGYYNQLLQYGMDAFIRECSASGIDGLIIPDLPMFEYEEKYKKLFEEYDIKISFLITPQTSIPRILRANELSSAFVYVVADSSITGKISGISDEQQAYFKKIEEMKLSSPKMIGFGIHDRTSFENACNYANGAIIGSAFIRCLEKANPSNLSSRIQNFIESILN